MPSRWPLPALLASLVSAYAFAQAPDTAKARVRGQVTSAASGQAMADAVVAAGEITVRTDAHGAFELTLPPGSWTLEARTPDHVAQQQALVLAPGEDRRVDFSLLARRRFRDEVTVEATAEKDEGPATLPVRPGDVLTVAGSADNVFRTLQTLPGVVGVEEFGSRLSVRGGGPDENLTVMDGVEIHNPYRLFGLTSAFNPETIRSFELSTGAFAARYGDRLSSLLVIENRDGDDTQRLSGTSSLSITDANVVVEGKLPKSAKGSWLVTGRRTYYDLIADEIVDAELPAFNDLQARTSWQPRPGRRLTALGLRSRESADARFEGDRDVEFGDFVTAARNDLLALRFDSTLGARGSSRTSLSWYRNTDSVDVAARFRDQARRSNRQLNATAFNDVSFAFTRDLTVRDVALRQDFAFGSGGRHLVEGGFEAHALETAVGWRIDGDRNLYEANGSSVNGGAGLPSVLDSSRNSRRAGAYLQDRLQVGGRLTVEPGVRFDHSGINDQTTLSPRLRATLRLGADTRLIGGTGLFTQSPGYEKLVQSDYFVDLSSADAGGLDSERSLHAVLGLERDLALGLLARVEGYYKTFDRLIVGRLETEAERLARIAPYSFPPELQSSIPTQARITTEPVNGATGRAYGFDLYVARRAVSADTRLTGWASYTYGRATRDVYGHRRPFEYDRPHAVSAVAAMRVGRKVEVSATGRVASGFPYTPIIGLRVNGVVDTIDYDGDRNRTEIVPEGDIPPVGEPVWVTDLGGVDNLLSARLPAFARVDARVAFRPRGPNGRWLFYLDAINVLNRRNVGAYEPSLEYNPDGPQPRLVLEPTESIPFLPSFGIRFRF
jgi:hypothetical protein